MLKVESNNESGLVREKKKNYNKWARACDMCHSAACTVYCEADSAYLCTTCDAQIHAANRVRVCESCESAPAAFLCKADAASLCVACDSEIHSANPLASRHQRVPILPQSRQYHTNSGVHMGFQSPRDRDSGLMVGHDEDEDEEEVASWLLLNPAKTSTPQNNGFLFGVEYLDLVDYNTNQFEDQYQRDCGGGVVIGDGVVPLQVDESRSHHLQQEKHQQNFQLGINNNYGGCSSEAHYNNYNGSFQDLNHSVSVSSMDLSIVPESSTCDSSRTPKETILDQQRSCLPTQLSPMDREARVMRYREKKKTRKFEKTIRYASRKAYAEIRPRIKGRFAKRIENEGEAEQMYSTSITSDTGYGIVPSF